MTAVRQRINLDAALARLTSLHEGDIGVIEVTAFGPRAIEPLRRILFTGEPSGLFETRCRAVDALAALGARDVLLDFLATIRDITDAVERVGEDAVINAAARALAGIVDDRAFDILLSLARVRKLAGVIAALGASGRSAAIPYLVAALEEDDCRLHAERALRKFGPLARQALLEARFRRLPSAESEGVSSRRRRWSAARLLNEIG